MEVRKAMKLPTEKEIEKIKKEGKKCPVKNCEIWEDFSSPFFTGNFSCNNNCQYFINIDMCSLYIKNAIKTKINNFLQRITNDK